MSQKLYNGSVVDLQALYEYQYPNSTKNVADAINAQAKQDTANPPLYYLMTRFWVQLFGNSVAVIRSLSALFSVLAWPCMYWLCRELFRLPMVGWMAIALMTISPFHVSYAQEARPYSLWTLTILLSSWALLRALRLKTKLSWIIYAVTVPLGFYTHLYSLFVFVAQGIYVAAIERFQFNKTVKSYILASGAGFLAFTPWIFVFILNWSKAWGITSWLTKSLEHGTPQLIFTWATHVNWIFNDFGMEYFNFSYENPFPYFIVVLAIVTLVGYSIYHLCRFTPKQTWLSILLLIAIPALGTILPDLIFGGRRSAVIRYLVPSILGIQLVVAYFLGTQIVSSSVKFWQQKFLQIVVVIVFSLGVLSCANSFKSQDWWGKAAQRPEIARVVNQAEKPLIINEYTWQHLFSLSYLLEPKVKFLFIDREKGLSQLPNGFSDYFLYNVKQDSIENLEKNYGYKSMPSLINNRFLRIEKVKNKT